MGGLAIFHSFNCICQPKQNPPCKVIYVLVHGQAHWHSIFDAFPKKEKHIFCKWGVAQPVIQTLSIHEILQSICACFVELMFAWWSISLLFFSFPFQHVLLYLPGHLQYYLGCCLQYFQATRRQFLRHFHNVLKCWWGFSIKINGSQPWSFRCERLCSIFWEKNKGEKWGEEWRYK